MPNAEAQLAQNQEITMRISQQDAYRPLQRVSAGLTRCSRWNIQRPQNDIGCRKKKQRTPDPFQPLRTFDTTSTSFIHDLSLDLATSPLPRHYCTYCFRTVHSLSAERHCTSPSLANTSCKPMLEVQLYTRQ